MDAVIVAVNYRLTGFVEKILKQTHNEVNVVGILKLKWTHESLPTAQWLIYLTRFKSHENIFIKIRNLFNFICSTWILDAS